MSIPEKLNLNQIIADICDKLLDNNQLITVKNVQNQFVELYPKLNVTQYLEDNFINSINIWRISKLNNQTTISTNEINPENNLCLRESNDLYKENIKLQKELSRCKREVQFLQAKIKSLNSCYNRQRKEFIMRIQRMLYQSDQSWR